MKFEVTYRDAAGARRTDIVDAADRASLWSVLKQRGIAAITVNEVPEGKRAKRRAASPAPRAAAVPPPHRTAAVPRGSRRRAASPYRGLVAALIVVAGAAAAYFWFFGGKLENILPREPKKGGKILIREVTPEIVTNRPAAKSAEAEKPAEEPKKPLPYWLRPTPDGLSECQRIKWKHFHTPPPSYTNTAMLTRERADFEIFRYRSENEIAMLMTIEPGQVLVGSPDYGEDFVKDFLRSCEEPIIPSSDDSEHDRQLKREMSQMKIELRNRMAAGEDLCAILSEARKESMRLGQIKEQIEGQMNELINQSVQSEDDLDDCLAAANKMLAEKGIAPIEDNPIVRAIVREAFGERQGPPTGQADAAAQNAPAEQNDQSQEGR